MKPIALMSLTMAAALCAGPLVARGQSAQDDSMAVSAAASNLAPTCDRMQGMSSLQRRMVAKAAEGSDALREFLWIRRGILQLDMISAVDWLDQQRNAQQGCLSASAATATTN